MPELKPKLQTAVDRYANSLKAPRYLFDLYPNPRPQGAPSTKYRAIPPAVVQGITAAFESFAEELLATLLIQNGSSWAQIAVNADMTNPTLRTLSESIKRTVGIEVTPAAGSTTGDFKLWRQSGASGTGWMLTQALKWEEVLRDSESWIQVRHCLTHGLVTGTVPATWPGPVTKKALDRQHLLPTASEVLATSNSKRSLTLYPAVNCGLIYTKGAIQIVHQLGLELNEKVNTSALDLFSDV